MHCGSLWFLPSSDATVFITYVTVCVVGRLVARLLWVREIQRSLPCRPCHQRTTSSVWTHAAGTLYYRRLRSRDGLLR